jgi:hypothetical protein
VYSSVVLTNEWFVLGFLGDSSPKCMACTVICFPSSMNEKKAELLPFRVEKKGTVSFFQFNNQA